MAATILLSDNGVSSGITGYQLTGGSDGTLQLQTTTSGGTATTALTINNSQVVTFANPPTGVFPSGTAMLFAQTSAPTGWTKSTTHNNKALRVVSGTASSGGSVDFTTAFASQAVSGTVGDTTLSTAQMPAHYHTYEHWFSNRPTADGGTYLGQGSSYYTAATDTVGGSGSHNHSFTGTAINLAVRYVDVIIATKD